MHGERSHPETLSRNSTVREEEVKDHTYAFSVSRYTLAGNLSGVALLLLPLLNFK